MELIVVDNMSIDGTPEIAAKCGARVFSLRAERSLSRNFGAQQAEGQYLLFIDSDMRCESGTIEEAVRLAGAGHEAFSLNIPCTQFSTCSVARSKE